jgi:hypothetical protein
MESAAGPSRVTTCIPAPPKAPEIPTNIQAFVQQASRCQFPRKPLPNIVSEKGSRAAGQLLSYTMNLKERSGMRESTAGVRRVRKFRLQYRASEIATPRDDLEPSEFRRAAHLFPAHEVVSETLEGTILRRDGTIPGGPTCGAQSAVAGLPLGLLLVDLRSDKDGKRTGNFAGQWADAVAALNERLTADGGDPIELHVHDLRRSAHDQMRRAGVDPETRRQIMGHKTGSMDEPVLCGV